VLVTCTRCCHTFHDATWHFGVIFLSAKRCSMSIWRPGCTSQDIGKCRLDTDPARRLPPCSYATIKPSRPSPVCRAPESWLRRDILLLRWTSPHDATVSSILPAFPPAYFASLRRTRHHNQDNGLRQCVHTVIVTYFCLSSHFIRLTLFSYPSIDGLHTAVITSGEYLQLRLPHQEVPDIRWVMSRCSSVVQDGTPRPQAPLP
jgi:hypothetical protein